MPEEVRYSPREMMTIQAAREITDEDIVFCGTGISMLAATAAKHIYAPNSVIFFETGAIDSQLEEIPLAVADPRIMYNAASNAKLLDSFATMQNPITGQKVVAILGAAQIDRYGNLNSTCIGDYHRPKIRFAGSGGGCDVASFVPRVIAFMQHQKRKFPEKLAYLTSPGGLDGPGARTAAGLKPGGVQMVVTNLGVMRFDEKTGGMYLDRHYPGVTTDEILDNMAFSVDVTRATEAQPPTQAELATLRDTCDPQRLIIT
jgi:glutaconate CoA-transferase subunit B